MTLLRPLKRTRGRSKNCHFRTIMKDMKDVFAHFPIATFNRQNNVFLCLQSFISFIFVDNQTLKKSGTLKMRRFLGPFRPFLGSVFECFSFFFTQKNSRFLSFFAVFCHIFRKNPALFFKNPALFRQNPALFHQNPALIYSTFIAASRIRIACKVTKHSAQSSQFVGKICKI